MQYHYFMGLEQFEKTQVNNYVENLLKNVTRQHYLNYIWHLRRPSRISAIRIKFDGIFFKK